MNVKISEINHNAIFILNLLKKVQWPLDPEVKTNIGDLIADAKTIFQLVLTFDFLNSITCSRFNGYDLSFLQHPFIENAAKIYRFMIFELFFCFLLRFFSSDTLAQGCKALRILFMGCFCSPKVL
jgi:hypothetical protein